MRADPARSSRHSGTPGRVRGARVIPSRRAVACPSLALLALLTSSLGCGPSLRGGDDGLGGPIRVADLDDAGVDETMLAIPPVGRTVATLGRAKAAAAKGNVAAAWVEVAYLLDLFDYARATGDKETRRVLLEHLQIPPSTPDATGRAIAELLIRVDHVLATKRLHPGAGAARALLEYDEVPPSRRSELLGRVATLKAIARAEGPLAANARLRLLMMCARSLRDALAAPAPARPQIIATCLYPLWDSDPEPYFAPDPEARPPEPAWQDVVTRLNELAEEIRKAPTRIKTTGTFVANATVRVLAEKKALLPTRRAPAELGVPSVERAPPYEWTPIVQLGDGKLIAPDLGKKVAPFLALDGRKRLAVALAAAAPGTALLEVARLALTESVRTIELVVGTRQTIAAPPGDYWHGRVDEGHLDRLGVLPLELAGAPATSTGRDRPREGDADVALGRLGLHLVVADSGWQLTSETGSLPALPSGAGQVAALGAQLAHVRDAFAEEAALVIVPGPRATVGAIVAAVVAARTDGSGSPTMSSITLGLTGAPKVRANALAARLDRRAGVVVTIAPAELVDRAPALRRCLQETADTAPPRPGTLALEIVSGQATVVTGAKDPDPRACALDRLGAAMIAGNITRATVTISNAP